MESSLPPPTSPHPSISTAQARFPELACHSVNLMLIKMVIGRGFQTASLSGQVSLPAGLTLER